jgi:hypothetical protein
MHWHESPLLDTHNQLPSLTQITDECTPQALPNSTNTCRESATKDDRYPASTKSMQGSQLLHQCREALLKSALPFLLTYSQAESGRHSCGCTPRNEYDRSNACCRGRKARHKLGKRLLILHLVILWSYLCYITIRTRGHTDYIHAGVPEDCKNPQK